VLQEVRINGHVETLSLANVTGHTEAIRIFANARGWPDFDQNEIAGPQGVMGSGYGRRRLD